jgi:hypothetical protein
MNLHIVSIDQISAMTPVQRLAALAALVERGTIDEAEAIGEIGGDADLIRALMKIGEPEIATAFRAARRTVVNRNSGEGQFGDANNGPKKNASTGGTGEGYLGAASNGQICSADPRPPQSAAQPAAASVAGHVMCADEAACLPPATLHRHSNLPDPETGQSSSADKVSDQPPVSAGGADHRRNADKAKAVLSAPPYSEPSSAALSAAARVAHASARTALMIIDGRDIREWTIGQCLTAGRHKSREARVLTVIGDRLRHLTHTERVGNILGDDALKEIIRNPS